MVCLERPAALAVGPCDHHQLCAMCCLRLRLCYHDTRCPLCKTEAKQVRPPAATLMRMHACVGACLCCLHFLLLTLCCMLLLLLLLPPLSWQVVMLVPKRGAPVPLFDSLVANMATLWQKPKWAGELAAAEQQQLRRLLPHRHARLLTLVLPRLPCVAPGGVLCRFGDVLPAPASSARGAMPLYVRLLQMTAVACPVCDKGGQRPLPSMRALQEHLASAHEGALQLCPTCVTAHRKCAAPCDARPASLPWPALSACPVPCAPPPSPVPSLQPDALRHRLHAACPPAAPAPLLCLRLRLRQVSA